MTDTPRTIKVDISPTVSALRIVDNDGAVLFELFADGRVEGAVEHASEAAAVFVAEIRRLFGAPAPGPCPTVTPPLTMPDGSQRFEVCGLRAGHAGAHESDNGVVWLIHDRMLGTDEPTL